MEGGQWLGWHPAQIAFLRDLVDWKVPTVFAICCRGWGKTWLTALAICCLVFYNPRLKINVFSGSKDQARHCYRYMKDMINYCPEFKQKVFGKPLMSETRFLAGGWIKIIAAAGTHTKGGRCNINIIDEVCETDSHLLITLLGTSSTAVKEKMVLLTTPDNPNHLCKDWWDNYEHQNIIRYQFTAFQTKHITLARIERARKRLPDADFRIMYMAEWHHSTGSVFRFQDIQSALIQKEELPPMDQIDHYFMGIDWGDAHETVACVFGVTGDFANYEDQWYCYAVRSWKREYAENILDGIMELATIYEPQVLSEQAAISAFNNRTLRDQLRTIGLSLQKTTFSKKKHQVVANFKGRLEKGRVKIPREFKKLINQLMKYHYKEVNKEVREEYAKKDDDYVDACLWSHWGIHPAKASIETIGEIGEWEP